MDQSRKVIAWAYEHFEDFLVVCGLKVSGTEHNKRLCEEMYAAGFEELSEMMALRVIQLMFEDDPEAVEAERQAKEEFLKQKMDAMKRKRNG